MWLEFKARQSGEMALGREETWRRAAGPWELGGKVWLLPMGLGMAARGSVSRRAQGSSGLWELRRETSTETGLGPRQGSFGKACLLLGTQLGDLPRKEFLWISLSSSRSTDAPDFYSCSSGNGGFKTILFFLLSLFGVVCRGRERRGALLQERVGYVFALGSQVRSEHQQTVSLS